MVVLSRFASIVCQTSRSSRQVAVDDTFTCYSTCVRSRTDKPRCNFIFNIHHTFWDTRFLEREACSWRLCTFLLWKWYMVLKNISKIWKFTSCNLQKFWIKKKTSFKVWNYKSSVRFNLHQIFKFEFEWNLTATKIPFASFLFYQYTKQARCSKSNTFRTYSCGNYVN